MAPLTPEKILQTIRKAPRIPAPSQTVSRILSLTQDPNCNLNTVAELIQRDGALTVQLLRQANSALFAGAAATSNVKDACVRLGLKRVRAAIINDHIVSGLGKACPPGFNAGKYWQASLATSVAAHDLCRDVMPAVAEEAGTAGLLCDIGVGLLAYGIPEHYRPVLDELPGCLSPDLQRIERRIVGITHAEVGAAILAEWKLDPQVINAVRFHHQDDPKGEAPKDDKFCGVIAAAVTCSQIALFGSEMEVVDRLFTQVGAICPNPDAVVSKLLDHLVVHVQQTAENLAVELGETEELAANVAGLTDQLSVPSGTLSFRPMDRHNFER